MVKLTFLFLFVILVPVLSWAQPRLQVAVDPTSGSLDDEYLFNVEIEGQGRVNYPSLQGGDDFKINLIGPEQRVNIVNGQVNQSIIFRYKLIPKKSGQLQTPAVQVTLEGQQLEAEPLEVKVSAEKSQGGDQNKAFKLTQRLNKPSGYVGEQLSYSLEIEADQNVRQLLPNFSSFDNFWVQDYEESKRLMRGMQTNGLVPGKPRFKKALFPLKPGPLEIAASQAKILVPKPRRRGGGSLWDDDPFEMFNRSNPFGSSIFGELLGQEYAEKELESNPLSVEIKELPAVPNDQKYWTPGQVVVGETSIRVEYSPEMIKAGDSKTIQITITSYGNLNPIDTVPLELPTWINKYEEFPQLDSIEKGDKLQFSKKFNLSLVPQLGGQVNIAGIKMLYFDPESASYKYAQSNPIVFDVDGPVAAPTPLQSAPNILNQTNSTLASPSSSPIPIATPTFVYEEQNRAMRFLKQLSLELLCFILGALGILGAGIIIVMQKQKAKLPLTRVRRQIEEAETFETLSNAFKQWLKLHFKLETFNPIEIGNKIPSSDLRFLVNDIQDQLNLAIFGGINSENNQINSLRIKILDLIDRL